MDHVYQVPRDHAEEEEGDEEEETVETPDAIESPSGSSVDSGRRFSALRPQKGGFYRGLDEAPKPAAVQDRGNVFRRKIRKSPIQEADGIEEGDTVDAPYDSDDESPVISTNKHSLSTLQEEASRSFSSDDGESEEHQTETSDYGVYSSNETSDNQDDSAPQTPMQLSDREDGENNATNVVYELEIQSSQSEEDLEAEEEEDFTTSTVEGIKSLHRKVALAPVRIAPSVQGAVQTSSSGSDVELWDWPTEDKAAADPLESSGQSITDSALQEGQQEGHREGQQEVQQDGGEKKKLFKLRGIRKQRKMGATSPMGVDNVAVEEGKGDEVNHEADQKDLSPAKLRHRKPFGRKKNKARGADEDPTSLTADDSLGHQEGQKGVHLRLPRGHKVARSDQDVDLQEVDGVTPKKEKVGERIRRRLKKGPKGTAKGGNEDSWEWENSESDEANDSATFSQLADYNEDSQSDAFDGSDLHAGDLAGLPDCGVSPLPVRDGVPIRSRLKSKDRKELRVKPYHCFSPHKVFMTQDEIYKNMVQPSETIENVESFVEPWYEVKKESVTETEREYWGSPDDGRIGSLRVEVLGCVGLSKQKADAIVYLVCGDAAFATDVIPSSRSPMWPACSKRAACFPIFHAYASLYVGVFDVVAKRSSENDAFCGRASLDLAILRPDSEYDVTLPLRGSSFIYARRPQGVVRLRFSLHWFSERAAVLSYLKAPRNMASTYNLVEQPSIPCADPKTFRNVAVTIHGPELPGKYSKKAFQATMREFTLYWQNFKFMVKQSVREAVLYEQPLKSLYIFLGWMHCTISNSVGNAPPYVVGFLIILLLEGYALCAANESRSHGYSPVSIQELLLALLQSNKSRQIRPLLREKKLKSEVSKEENDCDPCDHMEFPFSDRYEYKRRSIEDSLVIRYTSTKREKMEELELQGRLSIYVKSSSFGSTKSPEVDGNETLASSINPVDIGDSEHGDFDSDPEMDVHGDIDNVFELDMDDEEENQPLLTSRSSRSLSTSSIKSSIVVGPPQDTDMKPKRKVPPQVHLARLEDKLNKLTQSLSMDKVFSSTLAYRPRPQEDEQFQSVMGAHVAAGKKKGKRIPLDEFDKRLGYRLRHPNPITEITSSYLGPLMRIFRILCTVTRVVFNIGVWNDPYLSFWVLCFLILLLLVLIAFPWRIFLFAVGIVGFGPQNFLVGRRLARKAMEKAQEVETEIAKPAELVVPDDNSDVTPKKGNRRAPHKNPIAKLKERRQKRLAEKQESREAGGSVASSFAELEHNGSHLDNRPAFSAAVKATRKQVQPREIVVPYSRFRKERFYDWPPDPTGSRATPIRFENCRFEPTELLE